MKIKLLYVFIILVVNIVAFTAYTNSIKAGDNETLDDWIGDKVDVTLWSKSTNLSKEVDDVILLSVTDFDKMNGGIVVKNRRNEKFFIYHESIQAVINKTL